MPDSDTHPYRLLASPPPDAPPPRRTEFRAALEPWKAAGRLRFGRLADYPELAEVLPKAVVLLMSDGEAWEEVKRLGDAHGFEMWE